MDQWKVKGRLSGREGVSSKRRLVRQDCRAAVPKGPRRLTPSCRYTPSRQVMSALPSPPPQSHIRHPFTIDQMFTADFFRHLDVLGHNQSTPREEAGPSSSSPASTSYFPAQDQQANMDWQEDNTSALSEAQLYAAPSHLQLPSIISGEQARSRSSSPHIQSSPASRVRSLTGEARKSQHVSILNKWRQSVNRGWGRGERQGHELNDINEDEMESNDSALPSLSPSSSASSSLASTSPLVSPLFTSASSLVSAATSSYFPVTRSLDAGRSLSFLKICSLVTGGGVADAVPEATSRQHVLPRAPLAPLAEEENPTVEETIMPPPRPASPVVAQTYEVEAMDPNSRHLSLRRSSDPANALSRTPAKFADDVKPAYTITNEILLHPRPTDEGSQEPIPYPGSSEESVRSLRHTHAPPAELIASGEAVSVNSPPQGAYAPHWTRFALKDKQGWCGICPEGNWYSMKRSQYMYHLQFEHGISSRTSTFFAPPTHLLKWNDMNSTTEGMCGHCRCWIPICFGPVRRISFMAWFKHASKCHRKSTADEDAEDVDKEQAQAQS